jgi:hypothetical protein
VGPALRYSLRDFLRGQHWAAPLVSFAAVDAIASAQTGSLLPTFAATATALLFIGAWLTVVVINNEDPIQQMVTEACLGSRSKLRATKMILAFLATAALGSLGMIGPVMCLSSKVIPRELVAGLCAQLITSIAAVALGALCSRPLVRRIAWSVLFVILICLATVIIPGAPPTRQLLVLFNKTGSFALAGPLLLIGVETLALSSVGVAIFLRLSLSRE